MSVDQSVAFAPVHFSIEGQHAELASESDIVFAINQAREVFARNNADPLACARAVEKMESDELLSREEALLCLIWDEAEEVFFKSVTIGWLSREVDIRLKVTPVS
jgi:hypothetical protein